MPAFCVAQVELPFRTAVPEDVATNSWWFENPSADFVDVIAELAVALPAFYNAIKGFLSPAIEGADCSISFYDHLLPPPRTPTVVPMPLDTSPTPMPLPLEVALCLSFRGPLPKSAAKRGRVYLGPLNTTCLAKDSIGRPEPVSGFIDAIQTGLIGLGALVDQSTLSQVIYSRTHLSMSPVAQYWVDNEFDTQRRRQSVIDTQRTAWAAPVT